MSFASHNGVDLVSTLKDDALLLKKSPEVWLSATMVVSLFAFLVVLYSL